MGVKLSTDQILLISLLMSNFIRELFNQVGNMTPDEVSIGLATEKERKDILMSRLEEH